jgi:hypothetical protein
MWLAFTAFMLCCLHACAGRLISMQGNAVEALPRGKRVSGLDLHGVVAAAARRNEMRACCVGLALAATALVHAPRSIFPAILCVATLNLSLLILLARRRLHWRTPLVVALRLFAMLLPMLLDAMQLLARPAPTTATQPGWSSTQLGRGSSGDGGTTLPQLPSLCEALAALGHYTRAVLMLSVYVGWLHSLLLVPSGLQLPPVAHLLLQTINVALLQRTNPAGALVGW